jgi:hypothetical protein
MLPYETNVRAAMGWLDETVAGWRSLVDWFYLDMSNPVYCIAGQVFGDFIDDEFCPTGWDYFIENYCGTTSHEVFSAFDSGNVDILGNTWKALNAM